MSLGTARVALVTGASSGIGAACAARLASDGFALELCARGSERLESVATSLRASGADVMVTSCDVTDESQVAGMVANISERRGRIDVLVNAAGRSGGGSLASMSSATWDEIMTANLTSVFVTTRAVLAGGNIESSAHGRIINIASTAGKQGIALATPYCASKHAVVGFSKSLGLELARSNVTVNAVCPGYVDTPMADEVVANYATAWGVTDTQVREKFEAKIPKGRYGRPDEVAELVAYLAAPQSDIVTAQAINVCGGLGNF